MFSTLLFLIFVLMFGALLFVGKELSFLNKDTHHSPSNSSEADDNIEVVASSPIYLYGASVLLGIGALVATYLAVQGTPWEGHLREWLNIVVRLMHVTFGIAWIGASFYFVFLENALNRTKDLRDELAGNLWAVHGGGFYYLEKYKLAPKKIPEDLHWFKYEAYFTWLSGIGMLIVVYYMNASSFLIDPNVLDISEGTGIAIGLGSLAVAWIGYDLLCKTPLIQQTKLFAFIGLLGAIGFAFFYTHVFSGRAAYIHFGAMLGTLMAANVFFVIIPAQKAMVKAATLGKPLDPKLGKMAGMRSLHNNYMTLPVLFTMLSNHFGSTFGSEYAWQVLIGIALGTAGIKHYLNLIEKKQEANLILPVSIGILLAVAFVTAPPRDTDACTKNPTFTQIQEIITKRCVTCHSSKPTDDTWTSPPNGVVYDTPQDIVKMKDKIMERVVINKTMPQNNKTNITPEERELIKCWIRQGANIK
jgi:uncharacterized membrane protein